MGLPHPGRVSSFRVLLSKGRPGNSPDPTIPVLTKPSLPLWVPRIELWSSGLCLYPQSHLASPTNFLLCHMVPTSLDTFLLHLLVISVWFTLWLYLSQTITWGRPVSLLFPPSGTREVSCVKHAGTSNPKAFSTSLVSLVKRVI